MNKENVRELLERALTRIETTGWTVGSYGVAEGPNCLTGAVRYALSIANTECLCVGTDFSRQLRDTGQRAQYEDAMKALATALPAIHCPNPNSPPVSSDPTTRVIDYNDYHCPGQAGAADVLRLAIGGGGGGNMNREIVRQILERALTRIETTGWTQRSYGPPGGPNCLAGAVNCAAFITDPTGQPSYALAAGHRSDAMTVLATVLPKPPAWIAITLGGVGYSTMDGITVFNDWQCRTAEDAADVLRLAIKSVVDGDE